MWILPDAAEIPGRGQGGEDNGQVILAVVAWVTTPELFFLQQYDFA